MDFSLFSYESVTNVMPELSFVYQLFLGRNLLRFVSFREIKNEMLQNKTILFC